MPTLRGWAVSGAGLALLALWYLLGERELLLTGIFLVAAELAAVGYVRLHTTRLTTVRRLQSSAVHSGDTTAITLFLSNAAPRSLRNVAVADQVEQLGLASFEVARIPGRDSVSVTYRVRCHPRGVYRVGPARVITLDPLGLAESPAPDGPVDRIVVYPAVEELTGLPTVRGRDPTMTASRPDQSRQGGEDFYTLREYQRGDDLRRVHWPTTAKKQELMIRRMETPWRPRARVLLDVRSGVYESDDAFERAVSGAASVVTHLAQSGFDADLWDREVQPVDAKRYADAMERLALVHPDDSTDVEALAGRIRQGGGGGVLVLVTGAPDHALIRVQQLLSNQHPATVLMSVAGTTASSLGAFHRLGVTTVTIKPGQSWGNAWLESMRSSWKEPSAS